MSVFATAPFTLRDVLEATLANGSRDYLVYQQERYTFEEHFGIVAGLARWLADTQGIGKGDRVAIGMRNYPEWLMTFWATQVLGAVAVPLNAWWTAPELRFALDDSGARFAVLDGERYDRLRGDLDELGLPTLVVRPTGPLDERRVVVGRRAPRARHLVSPLPDVDVGPDDDSTIIYSSGTTGRPKGVLSTHRNHVSSYRAAVLAGAVDAMTLAGRRTTAGGRPTAGGAAHVPVLPRRRLERGLRHDGERSEARAAVPVGPRRGARPHRAGAHHHHGRRTHADAPDPGVAGSRPPRPLLDHLAGLRRCTGAA